MAEPDKNRAYTTRVAVAMTVGVVLGFVGPVIAVVVPLMWAMLSGGMFRFGRPETAVVWDDALYYVAYGTSRKQWVYKNELGTDRSQPVFAAESYPSYAAATEADLYVFSYDRVTRFDGSRPDVTRAPVSFLPSAPFVYSNRVATLQVDLTRIAVLVWDGRSWSETGSLPCSCGAISGSSLRAVASGDAIDFLAEEVGEVRHRRAKLGDAVGDPSTWTLVARDVLHFEAVPLSGGAFVIATSRSLGRSAGTDVELQRYDGTRFSSYGKLSLDLRVRAFGLTSSIAKDRVYLTTPGFMNGDLAVYELGAGASPILHRPSGGPNFMQLILWSNFGVLALTALISLSLAFTLTRFMRTYKSDECVIGDTTVRLAPLSRRGLAQMVDSSIRMIPVLAVLLLFALGKLDIQAALLPPRGPLYIFGFLFAVLLWTLIELVFMSLLEWKTGKTPGKWLFRIRCVGVDLEPVGFGRALLRNLAEWADQMFSFAVGMAVVAFTEKRQRLGDLAARTIVISD